MEALRVICASQALPFQAGAEYRLVEIHVADGWYEEEVFRAPNDATAWERVMATATGEVVVLWRGVSLVGIRPSSVVRPFN